MAGVTLYDYQLDAINRMKIGCILCGGVGSGKSRTSLAFYYFKFLKPKQNVKGDTDLEDFEFEDYDEDEPEADTGETPEDEETEEETL